MKNLIFFLPNFSDYGAGNSTLRLCKSLNKKDYQISIISLGKNFQNGIDVGGRTSVILEELDVNNKFSQNTNFNFIVDVLISTHINYNQIA